MSVKWTEEQQKVIDTHGVDVLVSAAAGSGKTAVLVARILEMVTSPVHPVDIGPAPRRDVYECGGGRDAPEDPGCA